MKTNLLIYIPTFQRCDKLKNCLAAIKIAISGYERMVKVVVSNNGSTDNTRQYLDTFSCDWLTIIHKPKNEGAYLNILGAFNLNMEAEYLWIIGDDDYLMPDAISGLLKIIKDFPMSDYIFCNTKAFSPDQYQEKIDELTNFKQVNGGNVKSSQFQGTELVKFHQIVNPAIADTLLGELMVNCYRLSSIKDFDYLRFKSMALSGGSINWNEVDLQTAGFMSQPHNLPIFDCFSFGTLAVYCDQVRTFNFWGSAEWLNDYDLIFPCVILYLIKEYAKRGIIDREKYLALMKYFLNTMGPSLHRQIQGATKAKPFNLKIKSEMFAALIDYLFAAKN